MNLGPHHKDGCNGQTWRHSGDGYNRVRVCQCGAEDHDPTRESLRRIAQANEQFIDEMAKREAKPHASA